MLESLLRIGNVCWADDTFKTATDVDRGTALAGSNGSLQGRFAFALPRPQGGVALSRDRLGLNKLFLAIHESGRVLAANYLIDLVSRGVPFEAIYSVPAGHSLELDSRQDVTTLARFVPGEPPPDAAAGGLQEIARSIRAQLDIWFSRLAAHFGDRRICLCLSGGIDSGIVAALARQYFSDVTAYTYMFADGSRTASEDATHAERLAGWLRMPFRLVPASAEDVLAVVEDALCDGQDWRDFNVHCAIVNELVARGIRRDVSEAGSDARPLVLTGDLANELLADYTPVPYGGQEYYRLPALNPVDLRRVLVQGLDAGDREVGVFNRHGLDVVQPYGFVADEYLRVPGALIGGERSKQRLAKEIAGDLLPDFILERVKVRAQIGTSAQPTGILPVLVRHGYDAGWLRRAFCRLFQIEDEAFLTRFIRVGRYRSLGPSASRRSFVHGYVAA
jgi:asparagine synthetase B (glutamine-hydrolysing)